MNTDPEDLSLTEKLKVIVNSQGRLPPMLVNLFAKKLLDEMATSVLQPKPEKIPTEVWDYLRDLPAEVQHFFITSFCHGIITSNREMSKMGVGGEDPLAGLSSLLESFLGQADSEEPKPQSTNIPIFRTGTLPPGAAG